MKKTRRERRASAKDPRAKQAGRTVRGTNGAVLRLIPYDQSFDSLIGAISEDDLAEIRENEDVYRDTVLIALSDDRASGVGYLSRGTVNDGILTVYCTFDVDPEAPGAVKAGRALLHALKERFDLLKPLLPVREARLTIFAREESETAAFLTENGFCPGRTMSVFRNDLKGGFTEVSQKRSVMMPDGSEKEARIEFLDVSVPENMERYILANGRGFGYPDSAKGLLFRVRYWKAGVFAWTCENEVLSAVTVWPQRSTAFATEDVFCVPHARRQGLTEQLLLFLLKKGKDEGYACADLNVFAHNEGAIRLYEKCGYERQYDLTEYYAE